MHETLLSLLDGNDDFLKLKKATEAREGPASVFGVSEDTDVYLIARLAQDRPALVVAATERDAAVMADRLSVFLGDRVCLLPPKELQLRSYFAKSRELTATRIRVLEKLTEEPAPVAVACAEAAMQALAPPEAFVSGALTLRCAERADPTALPSLLTASGYERVDKVDSPGQFRQSGGILDVFPMSAAAPSRVEFFDDEIDSIRLYDPATQRSSQSVDSVKIPPAAESPLLPEAVARGLSKLSALAKKRSLNSQLIQRYEEALKTGDGDGAEALLPLMYDTALIGNYLPDGALTFLIEPNRIAEEATERMSRFTDALTQCLEEGDALPDQAGLMQEPAGLFAATPATVGLFAFTRSFGGYQPNRLFRMEVRSPSRYNAALDQLKGDLDQFKRSGVTVLMYAGARARKLSEDLLSLGAECPVVQSLERTPLPGEQLIVATGLPCGLELPQQKLAVFSEQDIYGGRKAPVKTKKRRDVTRFDIFADLKIGDCVVHEAYGIGVFKGIVKLTADGKTRDFMQLQYAGTDKLYVPTDQLDRVQKYIGAGSDSKAPKLSKLGGGEWNRAVSKVKNSVKELAFDLVALYADRKNSKGFAFSPDTVWQKELEEAFPYQETPDQLTSLAEIKADMESDAIMDRLLCGDVGYGKTEVALRAAFKAIQDSKQVALLVPTTVLAHQHFQNLSARFAEFPVKLELLSRYRTPKQRAAVLKGLKTGAVDMVVGTHSLLAKDVEFKDLGLLIIDEEQRFGVGHKELIKNLKHTVDVLTLSATPIPRTLHMALSGVRDMSVIETPPEDRYPVQTYVMEYSDSAVRSAIEKELSRGGQVFVLNNNVAGMEKFAAYLSELVPQARIAIAHGQMSEHRLEQAMMGFYQREFDVLLCSTIIESGLDIQNANTLIVVDADRMGLSQLYQLRGRVGRSNRVAYAYFTFRRDKVLSETAEKRLKAIREFTQFGSGFKIAMRDLEIRGAGDLIGPAQHGHLAEVGYDFYCKIMDEAIKEAKGLPAPVEIDTQMDLPFDAYLPASYIQDEASRLEVYKRIAAITGRDDVTDVTDELIDRFGTPPVPVLNLMEIAAIKAAAGLAGLSALTVRPGEARLKFHPQTRLSGADIIETVGQHKGMATIVASDPVEIRLNLKNLELSDAAKAAEAFILELTSKPAVPGQMT